MGSKSPPNREDVVEGVDRVCEGASKALEAATKNGGLFWAHVAGKVRAAVTTSDLLRRSVEEGNRGEFERLAPLLVKDLEDCRSLLVLIRDEERSLVPRTLRGLNEAVFAAREVAKMRLAAVPWRTRPTGRGPEVPRAKHRLGAEPPERQEGRFGYEEWRKAKDAMEEGATRLVEAYTDAQRALLESHARGSPGFPYLPHDYKVGRVAWIAAEWNAPGFHEEVENLRKNLLEDEGKLRAALSTHRGDEKLALALERTRDAMASLEDVREACYAADGWVQTPAHRRLAERRSSIAALAKATEGLGYGAGKRPPALVGGSDGTYPRGAYENALLAHERRLVAEGRDRSGPPTDEGKAARSERRCRKDELRTRLRVLEDIEFLFPHLFSEAAQGGQAELTEAFVNEALAKAESHFVEALAKERVASAKRLAEALAEVEARGEEGRRKTKAYVTAAETRLVGALANDRVACKERLAKATAKGRR